MSDERICDSCKLPIAPDDQQVTYFPCDDYYIHTFESACIRELQKRLAAAEARVNADESELARLLWHVEDQLEKAEALLREACLLVDEARLYELSTGWFERAKAAGGE